MDQYQNILARVFEVDEAEMERPLIGAFSRLNLKHASLLSFLFAPRTIEIEGYLFLRDFSVGEGLNEVIREILRSPGTLEEKISKIDSFNWFELEFLFSHERGEKEVTSADYEAMLDVLVNNLKNIWEAWFLQMHPGLGVKVVIYSPEETSGGVGIGITQARIENQIGTVSIDAIGKS